MSNEITRVASEREAVLLAAWEEAAHDLEVGKRGIVCVAATVLTNAIISVAEDRNDALEGLAALIDDIRRNINERYDACRK